LGLGPDLVSLEVVGKRLRSARSFPNQGGGRQAKNMYHRTSFIEPPPRSCSIGGLRSKRPLDSSTVGCLGLSGATDNRRADSYRPPHHPHLTVRVMRDGGLAHADDDRARHNTRVILVGGLRQGDATSVRPVLNQRPGEASLVPECH